MTSRKLDPNVRRLLEMLQAEGGPAIETLPPGEARRISSEAHRRFGGVAEPMASVVEAAAGGIPVRVYTPENATAPAPAVVYFHGGGWVLCSLDTHDVICRAIARRAGAVVVSVDYRLAPEHKFPAAIDDCYAATCWTAANAARLGIDPARIAVAGDSAGGNLATAVCIKARDERGPAVALQALIYPVADLSGFETASYREFAEGYRLSQAQMQWFRDQYLARPEDARHPYASPLLAEDLRGLPAALVITAECDPLRDEGTAYARRLEDAGVPVEYKCYAGMVHPFFSMSGAIPQAFDAFEQVAGAVRAARAQSSARI